MRRAVFATGIAGSVWLVSACADRGSKDTGGEVIAAGGGDDGTESCDGTPPVVESIDCENTGIQDHFETGEPTVTMALAVELSDDDGDLHGYRVQIFLDDELDGAVDPVDSPFGPVNKTLNVEECAGFEASVDLNLYLTGFNPEYDTTYEWGVVVTDSAGLESEMLVVQCTTPTETGEDGTGAGR